MTTFEKLQLAKKMLRDLEIRNKQLQAQIEVTKMVIADVEKKCYPLLNEKIKQP